MRGVLDSMENIERRVVLYSLHKGNRLIRQAVGQMLAFNTVLDGSIFIR